MFAIYIRNILIVSLFVYVLIFLVMSLVLFYLLFVMQMQESDIANKVVEVIILSIDHDNTDLPSVDSCKSDTFYTETIVLAGLVLGAYVIFKVFFC